MQNLERFWRVTWYYAHFSFDLSSILLSKLRQYVYVENIINSTPAPTAHLDLPANSNLSSWVPADVRPSGRRALQPSSLSRWYLLSYRLRKNIFYVDLSVIPENDHFLWSDLENRGHSVSTSTQHSVSHSENIIDWWFWWLFHKSSFYRDLEGKVRK